jgi:hypothetical protein
VSNLTQIKAIMGLIKLNIKPNIIVTNSFYIKKFFIDNGKNKKTIISSFLNQIKKSFPKFWPAFLGRICVYFHMTAFLCELAAHQMAECQFSILGEG